MGDQQVKGTGHDAVGGAGKDTSHEVKINNIVGVRDTS